MKPRMTKSMRTRVLLALAGGALTGCNLVFGLDEGTYDPNLAGGAGGGTSSSSNSSSSSSGTGGADWSCLGNVKPKMGDSTYAFAVTAAKPDSLLDEYPTGELCQAGDSACATSIPIGVQSNGALTIAATAPYLGGYGTLESSKYRPYIVELGSPVELPDPLRPMSLYTPLEVTGAFVFLGVKEEPGHGIALVFARDCAGAPAAGVRLESTTYDASTHLIYQDKNRDFQPGFQQTDEAGTALYGNIPAGEAREIVLRRSSDLAVVARANLHIREKTLTVIHIRPTP